MDSKAKYRCPLGMLKVNKLGNSYLNVLKLENYNPQEKVKIIIKKLQKVVSLSLSLFSK
jgi:hypothetical protein